MIVEPERHFMKIASLAGILIGLQVTIAPAWATDDVSVERMAMCKDSWLDWKTGDPAQLKTFSDHFRSVFARNESDFTIVPKSPLSIDGLRVVQAFPDSVGMGVGFSVVVHATFDRAKRSLEKALGKPLGKCGASDGMRSCELEIAEKRTVMLIAPDAAKNTQTLIGCYYLYEK